MSDELSYINDLEIIQNINTNKNRRSSILKAVDNCGAEIINRDERRGSRRVSWANTYQYKELHSDGTTIILHHELRNKSSEEFVNGQLKNNEQNCVSSASSSPQFDTEIAAANDISSEADDVTNPLTNGGLISAVDFLNKLHNSVLMNKSVAIPNNMVKSKRRADDHNHRPKHKKMRKNTKKKVLNDDVNESELSLNCSADSELTSFDVCNSNMDITEMASVTALRAINSDVSIAESEFNATKSGAEMELTCIGTSVKDSDMEMSSVTALKDYNSDMSMSIVGNDTNPNTKCSDVDLIHLNTPEIKNSNMDITEMRSETMIRDNGNSDVIIEDETKDEESDAKSNANVDTVSDLICLNSSVTKNSNMDITEMAPLKVDDCNTSASGVVTNVTKSGVDMDLTCVASVSIVSARIPRSANKLMARIELAKSAVRESLGLGMTEKLRLKKKQIEEKRKNDTATGTINLNALTPCHANSSDVRKTLNFDTNIAADLFSQNEDNNNNKDEIEDPEEAMDVDMGFSMMNVPDMSRDFEKSNINPKIPEISRYEIYDDDGGGEETQSSHGNRSMSLANTSLDSLPETVSPLPLSPSSPSYIHKQNSTSCSGLHTRSPITSLSDDELNLSYHSLVMSNDSFDKFIRPNKSNTTLLSHSAFYTEMSSLQLSFAINDDTLYLLADKYDKKLQETTFSPVIPVKVNDNASPPDIYFPMRNFNFKQYNAVCEEMTDNRLLISFVSGTFILDVRFGETIEKQLPFPVKEILYINMESLVKANEPLKIRQDSFILQFEDHHKPLITMAHDLIISSFEDNREQMLNKFKSSDSINDLLSDVSQLAFRAWKLLCELRVQTSFNICKLFPKKDGTYNLAVELFGLRKPIYLLIPINPQLYPYAVIKPKFIIQQHDRHLYRLHQFSAALLKIKPGDFNYIEKMIKGARMFIKAMIKLKHKQKKKIKQINEMEMAKSSQS